jgi:hypothetical protein
VSQRLRSWAARQFPFVLPFILLLLAWPWAFFGLLRFSRWPLWIRVFLAGGWLLATVWLFRWAPGFWGKAGVFVGSVAIVRLLWFSHPPKGAGDWVAEQEKLAVARFDGDLVTIENYRHTVYRSLEDYDVQFMERQFDLSQVESVDFLVVPFASWRGVAHVFVSFGFADGEYLAVSVEARREKHEPYSPIGGLFRQYEVIYAVGDERDVVAKRAVFQKHPVYLYRLKASPAVARAMLVSMLETATELAGCPQFYHTVTNTCTSNVLVHATDLENRPRRYDFRLVFPGYADGLGVEVGFVDAPEGLHALREASLINERAEAAPLEDGKAWSRAVREG